MSDLTIVPVDEVWVTVSCTDAIAHELNDYFVFENENTKFMRRQARYRGWDGKIKLFKLKDHRIYRGLIPRILEWAEQHSYTVENFCPEVVPFLDGSTLDGWLNTLDAQGYLPHPLRDYQRAALRQALDTHRGIIVSPTGSGKSYIIWLTALAFSAGHTLIIVPNTGLVAQMAKDFADYGAEPHDIQTIQGGMIKEPKARFVISTWQSIYELGATYFDLFGCVICDEVHLAKAKSLTGLMEKCQNVPYRFGFTGTINNTEVHRLILEGLFGDVTKVTSTNELVKAEQLAPLRVNMCVLKYPDSVRKQVRQFTYQEEVDFLVSSPARNTFVAHLVKKLKGNTLVLFNLIDKHGKALYEQISQLCPERHVHFVTGVMDAGDREAIRQSVEADEDGEHIIVASFGVFSTGVNLRRLHNLVFAAAGKSKIRTLQSIGRGLRTHASKTHITLYDVVDDLRRGQRRNYAWKHAEERSILYAEEKFPTVINAIDLAKFIVSVSPGGLASPRLDDETLGQGESPAALPTS